MNAPISPNLLQPSCVSLPWPGEGTHRIPNRVYTDQDLYERELERFFYTGHWCYVGLECEVPEPGDFRSTFIGERPVVLVRDLQGVLRVVENRCAHKGVQFCQKPHGNTRDFTCPYHQWNYALDGTLRAVPLRRGVKGQGGMPPDFKLEEHNLKSLKVASVGGAVFASFDANVEPFESYLGPVIEPYFRRTFNGKPLKLLGYHRQRIPGNWKLMQENIKDPYHAALLHVFFITFGLWRADQKSMLKLDAHGRHAAMISERNDGGANAEVTGDAKSFHSGLKLHDPSVLDVVHEPWWGRPSVVMQTIFPSVIIQQQVNSLSTRQIIPAGPDAFDFVWTHFGYAEDDPAMDERRMRQANLFGPSGYVSLDDGEVIEFSQQGLAAYPDAQSVVELGGKDGGADSDHMVTETLIRGLYAYWRRVMERP